MASWHTSWRAHRRGGQYGQAYEVKRECLGSGLEES